MTRKLLLKLEKGLIDIKINLNQNLKFKLVLKLVDYMATKFTVQKKLPLLFLLCRFYRWLAWLMF